jgi:hypothetical protein
MYYRKIKSGRWLFEIQKIGYPRLSKSFKDLRIGKKWARKIEHEIEIKNKKEVIINFFIKFITRIYYYMSPNVSK